MGSAFHLQYPRYSGPLTPTAPMAIRLQETFTFIYYQKHLTEEARKDRHSNFLHTEFTTRMARNDVCQLSVLCQKT